MTKIDRAIKVLCQAKGIAFKPWEFPPPWAIRDAEPCPYPPQSAAAAWWPKLLAIRTKLRAEAAQ